MKRYFPKRFHQKIRGLAFLHLVLPGLLGAATFLYAATPDLPLWRKQLQAAEDASDKPAIVELSRRMVDADPNDSAAWETLASNQLASGDQDRCAATLDAWQARVHPWPKVIDDLRGDLALVRKDDRLAERYWRLYVSGNPEATDALEKLANLSETGQRWQEAVNWRTRALRQETTPAGLIARANDYLELRDWDKAYNDLNRANAIDPTDAAVKKALPEFELLGKMLPRIHVLDAQIAKSPAAPVPWLDRARLFTLANRPNLALEDAEHAVNLAPLMIRPRIQVGEALLDLSRGDQAANMDVSYDLKRDKTGHVPEGSLRALSAADSYVLKNPRQAEPFVARAKALRQINQYTLALTDAHTAIKLDPGSAAAHFQAAHAQQSLGHARQAIAEVEKATLLDPGDPVSWYYRGLLEAQRADFEAAIQCQTRSLAIRESGVALLERAKCERRIGRIADADLDTQRGQQLPQSPE